MFALLLVPSATVSWSFKTFLEGEWDLERIKGGELTRAHYSLTHADGRLEGSFFEEGSAGERVNEMRVKVAFDPAAPDTVGTFSVAKRQAPHEDEEEPPTPTPVGEVEYGEFTTLFEFDFQPRNAELFWISESRCSSVSSRFHVHFLATSEFACVCVQVAEW